MATQTGPITKVYRLTTEGYSLTHEQLVSLMKDFQNIKKAKDALNKTALSTQDSAELKKIKDQISAYTQQEAQLTLEIKKKIVARKEEILYEKQYGETVEKTKARVTSEFLKLGQAYKSAKANAEEMATTFGKDSQEAIKAADAANVYYLKLKDINDAIKGRVQAKPAITPESVQLPEETQTTKLTYDKYTGTIQQNLTTLVENEAALSANKAAQKALTNEINAAGVPTEQQTLRLIQLREEATVLANKNRDLSTTVGNQVKEFNASSGSIDQMQAQLTNLQNSYERISLAERELPFGKELKAEIDILEPKVKELEASLGRFQRNVANYPKGSLLGLKQEVKDLTDQYNRLTDAERKSEKGVGLKVKLVR